MIQSSRCLLALVSTIVVWGMPLASVAHAAEPHISGCTATLLMDPANGEIFEEHNIHTPLPPASMVKLMTAYTIMKRIDDGSVKLDDLVTTSAFASRIGGSQVYLKQGEQFRVDELLDALMVQSGNDAAVALAEHVAGSSEGFVVMMNEEAKHLNMNSARFHFPHGLPPAAGQEPDLASAHDFALLSRAIIREFPRLLERTKIYQQPFRGGAFIMRNHNHLLRTFPGADGLKTGYYGKAGFSVAATAERNGIRMIAIVMGCAKRQDREKEAARLLAIGFAKYRMTRLAEKGAAAPTPATIDRGDPATVVPVLEDDVRAVIRVGDDTKIESTVDGCTGLVAPLPAGTKCGELVFKQAEREVARGKLIIPQAIAEAALWKRTLNKVQTFIRSFRN